MNAASNASICWNFINGSCRFGACCIYRHEYPVAPSALICRYFQKGGCWYGERCRFLHVLQPVADADVAGRRRSVPVVSSSSSSSSSSSGRVWPDRRGSAPALPQTNLMPRGVCGPQSHSGVNVSDPTLAADTVAQTQDTDSPLTASVESTQSSEAQAAACDEQETAAGAAESGAAAAASGSRAPTKEMEAFLQSKDVTCGICMEKVYEKADPRRHVFGILPNCSHSFCLLCIMTWRKTRDLGPDVVKTCPQCRVKSAFYVPNKYWVEGKAKERVVAAFKEKCSKKSCTHYTRHRWCPFKSDCLYRHNGPARPPSFLYRMDDSDDSDDYDGVDLLNFFIAMTLLGGSEDDDDDFELPFYLTEEYGL
ncbi:makorin, ring finger protein, 4 [Betta splendens]|uniref:RING-type E3 ubiquitin transferase n=1 Tax=Betta splendens TaxID=158456 RepID=A0A6P7N016_BETSP|nr:makorin, ring finger protein, 4 [Betta splendens]